MIASCPVYRDRAIDKTTIAVECNDRCVGRVFYQPTSGCWVPVMNGSELRPLASFFDKQDAISWVIGSHARSRR
jgi:hypothetical protein